jgi:hypothetical protein
MNNILKTSMALLTLSLALSTGAAYAAPTTNSIKKDSAPAATTVNQKTFTIEINGSALKETGFQTINGKEPMVPLRAVTEALGFKLTWNGKTKSTELVNGVIFTTVKANEDLYIINRMTTTLGTAPQLVGSILYVPASFLSEVIHQNMTVKENSIMIINPEQHMTMTGVITGIYNDGKYQSVHIQGINTDGIILNVGEDTVIAMADGSKLELKDLHIGMTVKAEHSLIMTMSLPPQTPTYKITVLDKQKQNDLLGTAGTLEEVQKDNEGNISITIKGTGLNDLSPSEVVLRISKDTVLIDKDGEAVKSSALVKGAEVMGFYSPLLTRSLPPIGTAVKVVVNTTGQ